MYKLYFRMPTCLSIKNIAFSHQYVRIFIIKSYVRGGGVCVMADEWITILNVNYAEVFRTGLMSVNVYVSFLRNKWSFSLNPATKASYLDHWKFFRKSCNNLYISYSYHPQENLGVRQVAIVLWCVCVKDEETLFPRLLPNSYAKQSYLSFCSD